MSASDGWGWVWLLLIVLALVWLLGVPWNPAETRVFYFAGAYGEDGDVMWFEARSYRLNRPAKEVVVMRNASFVKRGEYKGKQGIRLYRLDDCAIIDEDNWDCSTQLASGVRIRMIDGQLVERAPDDELDHDQANSPPAVSNSDKGFARGAPCPGTG